MNAGLALLHSGASGVDALSVADGYVQIRSSVLSPKVIFAGLVSLLLVEFENDVLAARMS